MTKRLAVGPLTIAAAGSERVTGMTAGRTECDGQASVYSVTGPEEVHLTLHDITWDNGERDVRAVDRHHSPQRFDRLTHGLRLTVKHHGDRTLRCDLRQARMIGSRWSNPRKATIAELSHPIGQAVDNLLLGLGATSVGTRSDLFDDPSPHRGSVCAIFPAGATHIPVVVYGITRIAPVLERIAA